MRNVLIVHYHFLPVHNVAVKRLLGYAKHLPAFGWQPSVLTKEWRGLDDADASWGLTWEADLERTAGFPIHHVADPTPPRARPVTEVAGPHRGSVEGCARALLGERGAKAVRKARRLRHMFSGAYPDEFVGWVRPAVAAGVDLARRARIDAIVSYCPPVSNHLVARSLARRLDVPWVPFFGDLYGFFLGHLPTLSFERLLRRAFHAWCLAPAAACAVVSPHMAAYVERTYRKRAAMVLTGFDPEDFSAEGDTIGEAARFVVSHVGSVYPGDQRPEIFFEGLDRFLERHPEAAAHVVVRFVGSKCDERLRAMLAGRPSARVCLILPTVGAATAMSMVRASDALLAFTCTITRDRHGTLSYPTKIFEAFGARRPVLAIPSDGDWVDALLARTNGGTSVPGADEVAGVLSEWYRSWRQEGAVRYHGRPEEIAAFSRVRQVQALSALLDSVAQA